MSKFLDLEGLSYYTSCFKPSLVELVNGGEKNLLDLSKATSVTKVDEITYSISLDGSLTVTWSGLTAAKALRFVGIPYIAGELVLSGCPSGGDVSTYRGEIRQIIGGTETNIATDNGAGSAVFELNNDTFIFVVRIGTASGTVTFKPMLCTKAAWNISHTYQPHRPSYQELYERVENNEANILMLRTFMAYVGYAEVINVEQGDVPNKIHFFIQSYYNGDVSTIKTGGLFARSLPLNTDLTVDNAEGDFYSTSSFNFSTNVNDSRGDGLGVSVKPYIEISGERHYGVQQRYFYNDL